MRLIDRLVTRNLDDAWANAGLSGFTGYAFQQSWGFRGQDLTLETYVDLISNGILGNGFIFGVESTRIGVFSEARFKYRSLADKRIHGNASLSALEHPWPDGTTGDLLARCLFDADAAGTSFTRRTDNGEHFERLRPDWVKVVREIDDQSGAEKVVAVGYQRGGVGDWEVYLAEDVVIWSPVPDPTSIWRGIPWLATIKAEVQNDRSMMDHLKSILTHSGTPNMVYTYQKKFKDDNDRKRLMEQLDSRSAGPDNAGRTLVLDDGAQVQVVGASLQALQFTDLSQDQRERIAAAAGMPPVLAGLVNQSITFGKDYAPAVRWFADGTLRYLWRSLCAAFTKFGDVPDGSELWYDTSDIAILQSGEQESAVVTQTQIAAISSAVMNGATYESAINAVQANDITLLVSSGKTSVQLHPTDGSAVPPIEPPTPKEGA